ncbi:AIR synthase [Adhaeribacter swui]|uniref:AIR synthase n=1 Tax=Adhaeribacter swui TaxID=2086471 RepID=A0A7G7G6P4_9BACT|nr:AIR synthase family protein [Adhaeribacter swui]QNF32828.1 AIR synthase [Adhaeribacter swui]
MKAFGKITQSDFDDIFAARLGHARTEVSTGPGFGVDVALIDLPNNQAMAVTSDPLSLIPSLGLAESAWLSVHLMANDMATTGLAPQFGQFVLNLPPWLSPTDFQTYWNYIHQFCTDIKVAITGGHTGVIEGQNSTIAGGGTFITVGEKSKMLVSKNARVGDVILVTKQCAISSTAILAMSFPETVKAKLGTEVYQQACDLFYQTSSLPEALLAAQFNQETSLVSAMHDVTEGGVLGAVYEMAVASGNGVLIENFKIPVDIVQQEVCRLFSLDPRYCIGAGAMLLTVKKGSENEIISALTQQNILATVIGVMVDQTEGLQILEATGEKEPLIYQQKDPYWAAFFTALQNNWK